jgi:hypothetical protein
MTNKEPRRRKRTDGARGVERVSVNHASTYKPKSSNVGMGSVDAQCLYATYRLNRRVGLGPDVTLDDREYVAHLQSRAVLNGERS